MRGGLWLILFSGCQLVLPAPADRATTCASKDDCWKPLLCQTGIGRCVGVLDETAPTIVSALATSDTTLSVSFSEAMQPASVASISVTPALAVRDAQLSADGRTLALVTDEQGRGVHYTLTLADFADLRGNALVEPHVGVDGFSPAVDSAPPLLVAPPTASAWYVADGPVVLAWSARSGASVYVVELSTQADFSAPFARHEVIAPATTLAVALADLPSEQTVSWRVRSDVGSASAARDFDVVDTTFYVACADGEDCADVTVARTGARSRPLLRIADAVARAALVGGRVAGASPRVLVAARAAGYTESVTITGGPLELLGGYNQMFSSRDIDGSRALVRSGGTVLRVDNVTATTLIEGMSFESRTGPGGRGMGGDLFAVGAELTLSHDRFAVAGTGGVVAHGLRVLAGHDAGPLVSHVDVHVGNGAASTDSTGIELGGASFRADHLAVYAGTAQGFVRAVHVVGPVSADVTVSDSSLIAADAGGTGGNSIGLQIDNGGDVAGAALRLTRVTAQSGAALGMSSGLMVGANASAFVDRSRFEAGDGPSTRGAVVDTCTAFVATNSLFMTHSTSDGTGVYLSLCNATLTGNTIVGGDGSGGQMALQLDAGSAFGPGGVYNLADNLLILPVSSAGTCLAMQSPTRVAALLANAFVNCDTLYDADRNGPVPYTDIADVEAFDGAALDPSNHRRVAGNVAVTGDPFALVNGVFASTGDYHLQAGAPTGLRTGGVSPTGASCGSYEAPQSCAGTLEDFDGTTRATPFSIGAYESP